MAIATPLRQAMILFSSAALLACLAGIFHPKRPPWDISAPASGEVLLQTALAWDGRALWIDARSEADFQKGHVPGALLLNEDDWDGLLGPFFKAWTPDKMIVVYCSSLQCQASKEVAERLRTEARLKNVYVLKGGWEAWLAAKR